MSGDSTQTKSRVKMMVKEGIEGVHIKRVQFENGEGERIRVGWLRGRKV